jgi:hypothetical protein
MKANKGIPSLPRAAKKLPSLGALQPRWFAMVLSAVIGVLAMAYAPQRLMAQEPSPFAQTSAGDLAVTSAARAQPPAQSPDDWRAGMARVPLPKSGCFTSAYPGTAWHEVPCTTVPLRPYMPARGPRPTTVGNSNDVSAETGTTIISAAVGSFDSVTGVTSETGQVNGSGGQVANTFSLQVNTNLFTTSACNGAATPENCKGWEQFIFDNLGAAYIQYWLLNYGPNCPANWQFVPGLASCYANGAHQVAVPRQVITNLAALSVTAEANVAGNDEIIVSTGSELYAAGNPTSILNMFPNWIVAEFNVFGDCCSSQANFNSGSTIVVRTAVDSGSLKAPTCSPEGYTAETNNLSFANPPVAEMGTWPAVVFTESTVGGRPDPCDSATEVPAGPFSQQAELVGSDVISYASNQGWSVALSADGSTAIVGGPCDDVSNNGYCPYGIGAAWVFIQTGGTWTQQAKLVPSNTSGSDSAAGFSVALSADGNTAIIGGPVDGFDAGAAWVFTRSNGSWTEQAKLVGTGAAGTGSAQGSSVALSADGNTAISGAPSDGYDYTNPDNPFYGAAWVFTRSDGAWTQQGSKLVGNGVSPDGGAEGFSVALSADGNTAAVGDDNDSDGIGAAWVYTRSNGAWAQQGSKLVGTGYDCSQCNQGTSVALSADGNTLIEGGPGDQDSALGNVAGAAWIFTRTGGVWSQQGSKLVGGGYTGSAFQGISASLSSDGDVAMVGGEGDANSNGGAWLFIRSAGTWSQLGSELSGSGATCPPALGASVALSGNADVAIAGGPFDGYCIDGAIGAAWVFTPGSNGPVPSITSISPSSGPAAGGTSVTITGANFAQPGPGLPIAPAPAHQVTAVKFGAAGGVQPSLPIAPPPARHVTAVKFGATAAASFTVDSRTSITAISPPGSGTVDVTVTTSAGTGATSPADRFTYQSAPGESHVRWHRVGSGQ